MRRAFENWVWAFLPMDAKRKAMRDAALAGFASEDPQIRRIAALLIDVSKSRDEALVNAVGRMVIRETTKKVSAEAIERMMEASHA